MSALPTNPAQYWTRPTEATVYEKLDDEEASQDESMQMLGGVPRQRASNFKSLYSSSLYAMAGFCLVGFGMLIGMYLGTLNPSETCFRFVSKTSPVGQGKDLSYQMVQFNGSFNHENIYRRVASPEVDAAWEDLGVDYRPGRITVEEAMDAGLSLDQVQINEKYGGGFAVNVEGLHHLHCLNLLRKSLYFNYEYYHDLGEHAFKNDDNIVRLHVTHCLDILRQQLMCSADTGVLGQVWWNKDAPTPFVDFNTEHRCKNYDLIREWAAERQLPEMTPEDFLAPPRSLDAVLAELP